MICPLCGAGEKEGWGDDVDAVFECGTQQFRDESDPYQIGDPCRYIRQGREEGMQSALEEISILYQELEARTAERDDAARVLHARAIAGSEASKDPVEFVYVNGKLAGTVYSTGEHHIAFDRHGVFIASGLTKEAACERCVEALLKAITSAKDL